MNQKYTKMNQKRITIPLDPEVEKTINDLAKLTGSSKSKILLYLQAESLEHLKLKSIAIKHLRDKGFDIDLEAKLKDVRIDVIGRKKDRTVIAECLVNPSEKLCTEKVLKYSKYADDIYFAISKEKFEKNIFDGLGVVVFVCDAKNNSVEKEVRFDFDEEIFSERKSINRTVIVNFRATDELIKDLEEIIKEARHYRNRSDLINEILRGFIRNYRTRNINSELNQR